MLITAVRSRAVSLPLQPVPYSVERAGTKREWGKTRLTPHRPKPSLQYVIVEIDTDDGITGVGEACTDIGFFGEPVEEVQSAIDLYLGPKLLGKDPTASSSCSTSTSPATRVRSPGSTWRCTTCLARRSGFRCAT